MSKIFTAKEALSADKKIPKVDFYAQKDKGAIFYI
jgi:hypothetical protein